MADEKISGMTPKGSNLGITDLIPIVIPIGGGLYATRNVTGAEIINSVPTSPALNYLGSWNANTNSPTLTSSVGTANTFYTVTVAGTTTLNGISSWNIGDLVSFNGTVWQKVPFTNFPVNFLGNWNANTNSPTLVSSVGTENSLYQVSVAGSTNLNGITSWAIGDLVLFNSTVWQKIPAPATAGVTIGLDTGSVSGSALNLISGTPTGCGATVEFFETFGTTINLQVTDGSGNTTLGSGAGNPGMGSFNTSYGANSSSVYAAGESSNANFANTGTVGNNNVMNLGTHGSGDGQQSVCKQAGINGNIISSPMLVTISPSTNQMGVIPVPPSTIPWPPDFRSGFELTWNDDATPSTLSITAGQCIDSTNTYSITGLSGILAVTDIDTGTFSNGQKYYLHVMGDLNYVHPTIYRFSLSYNTPVLPSGYNIFRVVQTVLSNSSGTPDFIPFQKEGHGNEINTTYESTDTALTILPSGSAVLASPGVLDYSNILSFFGKGVINQSTHTVNVAGSKLNICSSLATVPIYSQNSLLSSVSDIKGMPLLIVDSNKRLRYYLDSALDTLSLKLFGVKESFYSPLPPFIPTNLPNLTLWLDGNDPAATGIKPSSGSGVALWVDKSTAGNTAQQASGSNQPLFEDAIYGALGALVGDGVALFMAIPFNSNLNSSDFTLAVVCKTNTGWGDFQAPFSSRDISSGPSTGYNFYVTNSDNWTAWYGNGSGSYQTINDGSLVSSKFTLLILRCIAGVPTFYLNGVSIGSGAGFVPQTNATKDTFVFASENTGFKWPGYIGEIVYCNAALSDANLALLTAYEIARWGTV